jgi:Mg2+/Co2+ transporter CorB
VLIASQNDELTADLLRQTMREPYFCRQKRRCLRSQQFQEQQDRLCFVVDEYGELMGLPRSKTSLTAIGEFATHSPLQPARFHLQDDGAYLVEGGSPLRELNRKLGYRFPLDGPKTLNGLILEHLQDIPEPGVSLKIAGHMMDIVQTQNRVVKAVRLRRGSIPRLQVANSGARIPLESQTSTLQTRRKCIMAEGLESTDWLD